MINGIRNVPAGAEIDGVPVVFDASERMAEARGIWPFKRIVVGPRWLSLPAFEQGAILAHELGHSRGFHMEIRWLLLPVCWMAWAKRIGRQHEFDADAFAAHRGYGRDLMLFIARQPQRDVPFHPSGWERISHLAQLERIPQ